MGCTGRKSPAHWSGMLVLRSGAEIHISPESTEHWLLVGFGKRLTLGMFCGDRPATLRFSGWRCVDAGLGVMLGLHDWLRTEGGEVIGARLTAGAELDFIADDSGKHPYCEVNEPLGRMLVFFGSRREFDELRSDDQDLGSSLYIADDGTHVLCLSAGNDVTEESLRRVAGPRVMFANVENAGPAGP